VAWSCDGRIFEGRKMNMNTNEKELK